MLVVTGKVVTRPVAFRSRSTRGCRSANYPAQAFVTLQVANPDGSPASQAQVTHEVRWEWPLNDLSAASSSAAGQDARRNNAHPNRLLKLLQPARPKGGRRRMFNLVSLIIGSLRCFAPSLPSSRCSAG